MKQFLNLADCSRSDVEKLVKRAIELKAGAQSDVASRRTLGLIFLNPSLRTRVSMVGAWAWLGGASVDLSPGSGMWQLATDDAPMLGAEAEHIEEAAAVLGRLCDVVGVRAFAAGNDWSIDRQDQFIRTMAEHADAPFVNMESGMYHPCQALADRLTLDEKHVATDDHFVLSWAWHPKALPQAVGNSALLMAAQRGMKVTLLRPEGYNLDQGVMASARELADEAGGSLQVSDDPSVLTSAKVVYAKSWGAISCYGDPAAEASSREKHRNWCIGGEGFAIGDAAFMHCLPVRRDVVVSTEVLKSNNSWVLDQAENRKWAQAAVLEAMMQG